MLSRSARLRSVSAACSTTLIATIAPCHRALYTFPYEPAQIENRCLHATLEDGFGGCSAACSTTLIATIAPCHHALYTFMYEPAQIEHHCLDAAMGKGFGV